MRTTITDALKSMKSRMEREPIACITLAFLLLTGAAAGMTARQILTAAPGAINLSGVAATEGTSTAVARADHAHSISGTLTQANISTTTPGAVNLNSVAAAEGASSSLARADHTHSLSGTLPEARGGTGAGAVTCGTNVPVTSNGTAYSCAPNAYVSLQASTPGSADTGNAHVSGTFLADAALSLGATFGLIQPRTNGFMQGMKFTVQGCTSGNPSCTSGVGAYEFNMTDSSQVGPAYQFKGSSGSFLELDATSGGYGSTPANYAVHVTGLAPIAASSNPLRMIVAASQGVTIDTTSASNSAQSILSTLNNGSASGWAVFGDGSVGRACRFALNTGSISPGAVAANTCSTTAITSSSLVVGKPCVASASSAMTSGLIPFCEVTSTTNVNYKICNVTTGSVTPPAATTYNACLLGG